MDEWSKKKKAASNGGRGMCKYIDYEEQKRLSRLKNIRGSVNMHHNSWQANQLEKRRKEQIRQRKREAKRRAEKKGFRVDTGCAVSPFEFTKCGLKLRLEKSSFTTASGPEKRRTEAKRDANTVKPVESKQLQLVSKYAIDSIELNRRKPAPAGMNMTKRKDGIKLIKPKQSCGTTKADTNNIKPHATQKQQKDSCKTANLTRDNNNRSCSSSEGKENGDNPNRSNESDSENALACNRTLTKGKLLQKKKPIKKSTKSYFMDFESLKREHADAIEMLKQLDEENKRLFVRKDEGLDIDRKWSEEEEEEHANDDTVEELSAVITLPEGLLHATHLSISLHDIEDNEQDQDAQEVGVKPEAALCIDLGDEFDDESEAGHYYSICSRSVQGTDNEDEEDLVDVERN